LFPSIENDAKLLTFDKRLEKEFTEVSKKI
jgi:hypothetical protein